MDGDWSIIFLISISDKLENKLNKIKLKQIVLNASNVNGFELFFWESIDAQKS